MSQELQIKILEDFLHYFLPNGLLDYFEPVMAENKTHINPKNKVQLQALHLYFDEKDNRTEETQEYKPKGFAEETVFNDFPVRDKKLVLHVRRTDTIPVIKEVPVIKKERYIPWYMKVLAAVGIISLIYGSYQALKPLVKKFIHTKIRI